MFSTVPTMILHLISALTNPDPLTSILLYFDPVFETTVEHFFNAVRTLSLADFLSESPRFTGIFFGAPY
jgi:hypothetical protein